MVEIVFCGESYNISNYIFPLKDTSQRHIPYVACSNHSPDTHSYRHTDIHTIIIQYAQPRLNPPASIAIVLLVALRLYGYLHQNAVNCYSSGHIVHSRQLTIAPPLPSMTLPVLVSTTLACSQPPRKLSNRLPRPPQIVTAVTHSSISCAPHSLPPCSPDRVSRKSLAAAELLPDQQNGSKRAEVTAMVNAPK